MERRSHFPGKTAWQGLLKVQPKPVKEEGVWHGGHQSLGNILVPPLFPLLSSLSSGAPLAHRPHIKVVLIIWQPSDSVFITVLIWLFLVPGFP